MLVLPLPVIAQRDAWDWVVVWSTSVAATLALIAVLCALWAIHRGNVIAQNADEALVRERRMTFELGVLAQLAESAGYYRAGSANVLRALLRVLPEEDMPTLRQAVESGDTLPNADVLADYWEEYKQAVDRRRHPPSVTGVRLHRP
jgi:hypothetical protein